MDEYSGSPAAVVPGKHHFACWAAGKHDWDKGTIHFVSIFTQILGELQSLNARNRKSECLVGDVTNS